MPTKQISAVDWLVSELNQKIDFIPMDKWDMIKDIAVKEFYGTFKEIKL